MIDAGVALDHPALAGAHIQTRSFTEDGRVAPSAHGAAIASLLVGNDDDFQGAAPGAELYAADVFGDSAEGGSAVAIANALAWLSSQGVRVVNISLTGPPNRARRCLPRHDRARTHSGRRRRQ
jgi:subtilisin family serine protease